MFLNNYITDHMFLKKACASFSALTFIVLSSILAAFVRLNTQHSTRGFRRDYMCLDKEISFNVKFRLTLGLVHFEQPERVTMKTWYYFYGIELSGIGNFRQQTSFVTL